MGSQTQTAPILERPPQWTLTSLVAFRFGFVYFGLFCLTNQIITSLIPIPNVDIPDPSSLAPIRLTVFWTAAHVFHLKLPLVYTGSGSGDKTFDWVLVFCVLVIATAATVVWSIVDRGGESYTTLYKWFRLFLRFALAGQMFVYGMSKAVPLQMPFPSLGQLLEPYGRLSPMGVLWSSIGASPAYEMFTGCAEMMGGILLIAPRTTMVGALVCLADMVEVFMLNMTYDVPVKLFSFHLILLSLVLLAPNLPRLARFFFLHRSAEASAEPQLFRTRRANRIAVAVQVAFGLVLIGLNAYGTRQAWHTYGAGRPKSPLYGIWDVEQMSVDGQLRSPLLNDRDRWRRAIFDSPDSMALQRPDDTFAYFGAAIDLKKKTVALTKRDDKQWHANFVIDRPANDRLNVDGTMDNHQVHMQLHLFDSKNFRLLGRRFHWIQEYPYSK